MTNTNIDTTQTGLVDASPQTTASSSKGIFANETIMNLLPIILIFGVFYFFIIRPQIRKQKDQEALISSAKKGDKVIVAGGIIGRIIQTKENDIITLEISKGVNIEVLKSSIISIVTDKKEISAHNNKAKKK